MTLRSSFGSSALPPTDFMPSTPSQQPRHHGLVRNLLDDAVATARGIPFGLVQTVEHPVKTLHATEASYKDYYGHGWGHFAHEFHAHPLQPLLDAISVPLILAGGAGLAVKGASAAAELGRAGDIGAALTRASELTRAGDFAGADQVRMSAYRAPHLRAAAEHFMKGTAATSRVIETDIPGFSPVHAYSSNMFRRFLSRGSEAVLEGMVGPTVKKLSGNDFFTTAGKARRMVETELSRRSGAAASRAFGQVGFLRHSKDAGIDPAVAGQAIAENFRNVALETGIKVPVSQAIKLETSNPTQSMFGYVARQKEEDVLTASEHATDYEDLVRRMSGLDEQRNKVTLRGYDPEQVKNFVETLGQHFDYVNDPSLAHVDESGMVTLMRKETPTVLRNDISGAMKLATQVYHAPLKVWKFMILGDSPRYFVNNVIGNAGMYAAATDPVEFTRGWLGAIKSVHGNRAAAKAARQADDTIQSLMVKYLPNDFVSERFGYMQHGALGLGQTIERRQAHAFKRYSSLFTVTEKVAYRGPQRASLMGAMNTMPEFRNYFRHFKSKGMEDTTAYQAAAKEMLADPRKAAALEKRVADWAGQYYHMNRLEQGLTALVPFYNWTRHALRFGKEQVLSRPVSSVVMSHLGALGDKQATQELGHVPDFLKGAIPVGAHNGGILGLLFGQHIKGREKIILTAGYNPLASAATDAQAIAALVGGGHAREAIGSQLNPVISGAIAGITGQRLFSGARAPYSGPLEGAFGETFGQLPHVQLLRQTLAEKAGLGNVRSTKTKRGEPTLYTKDVRQQLSSILGLNERDFSPLSAQTLYRSQEGIKKGRRKKSAAAKAQAQNLKRMSQLKSQF